MKNGKSFAKSRCSGDTWAPLARAGLSSLCSSREGFPAVHEWELFHGAGIFTLLLGKRTVQAHFSSLAFISARLQLIKAHKYLYPENSLEHSKPWPLMISVGYSMLFVVQLGMLWQGIPLWKCLGSFVDPSWMSRVQRDPAALPAPSTAEIRSRSQKITDL